jgi:hypothetical protein
VLCGLGVLAVVAGIALGLPALDRMLPNQRAVAPGVAYPITDAITIVPPYGARLDVRQTRPGADSGYAVFVMGRVRFAVLVSRGRLSLTQAASRLRTRLRDGLGARPTGEERPLVGVAVGASVAGQFRAGTDAGWYAVCLVGTGIVVDATANGPPDDVTERLPAIEASAASIARSA